MFEELYTSKEIITIRDVKMCINLQTVDSRINFMSHGDSHSLKVIRKGKKVKEAEHAAAAGPSRGPAAGVRTTATAPSAEPAAGVGSTATAESLGIKRRRVSIPADERTKEQLIVDCTSFLNRLGYTVQ